MVSTPDRKIIGVKRDRSRCRTNAAVSPRHSDIEQDHRKVMTQQVPQGILTRLRLYDDPVWSIEQHLHRREHDRIVVDNQDARRDRRLWIRRARRPVGLMVGGMSVLR